MGSGTSTKYLDLCEDESDEKTVAAASRTGDFDAVALEEVEADSTSAVDDLSTATAAVEVLFGFIPYYSTEGMPETVLSTARGIESYGAVALDILLTRRAADTGDGLLHLALRNKADDLVRWLLALPSSGPDVNAQNFQGTAPLHVACCSGTSSAEMCELLVSNGAFLNCVDSEGSTPLICAAACGDAAITNLLLSQGASPEMRDVQASWLP